MDGRPHPPTHAPHTWMGFSTGRWAGDRLIVETTHIKPGWHRRNGVPSSDLTTMTEHYVRHGNKFTHIAVIRDPVYLTEPMVKSQHFEFIPRALPSRSWLWPCTVVEEVARAADDVPHYLPGRNPYLESSREEVHLNVPGIEGGAQTLYPEWLTRSAPVGAASRPRSGPDGSGPDRDRGLEAAPTGREAAPTAGAPDDEIEIWPIRDNVYMLVGAGANTTVQIGHDGVLVVDTKLEAASERLLAAIASLTDRPIRYIVNTHADPDHIGGNEAVAAAGATRSGGVVIAQIGLEILDSAAIIAHENVLARVSASSADQAPVPQDAWPTDTFFRDRRELAFNGEGIELRHFPNAHTDGDTIAYFRRSDVIAAGGVFDTERYPVIDSARGGTLQGTLAALNTIIEIAIPDVDHQLGTLIVPGHGRLSDEFDVVEYRDMLVIVRDRVQDMIARGFALADVQAARPTFDFDARYGAVSGKWTTEMFVAAVYADLAAVGATSRSRSQGGLATTGGSRRDASPTAAQSRRDAAPTEARSRRGADPVAAPESVAAPGSARAIAPVDLSGQWVSVVTEDWAWRMRTPPKGDYASVPLNAEGARIADTWTEDQDGACLAYGAASVLRMPTRVRLTWEDDQTLKLETDSGAQTRWLRFGAPGPSNRGAIAAGSRSYQGESRAAWQIVDVVTGSGADSGIVASRLAEGRWAPLEVVTTNLRAAWLRPNGVPYSENAVVTEYFDAFADGDDEWFTVTTIVDDPTYLTEPFVISSNFKRERDASKWTPTPCAE